MSAQAQRTAQIARLERDAATYAAQAAACRVVARRLRQSPCENEYEEKVVIGVDRSLLAKADGDDARAQEALNRAEVLRTAMRCASGLGA